MPNLDTSACTSAPEGAESHLFEAVPPGAATKDSGSDSSDEEKSQPGTICAITLPEMKAMETRTSTNACAGPRRTGMRSEILKFVSVSTPKVCQRSKHARRRSLRGGTAGRQHDPPQQQDCTDGVEERELQDGRKTCPSMFRHPPDNHGMNEYNQWEQGGSYTDRERCIVWQNEVQKETGHSATTAKYRGAKLGDH